MKKKKKGGVKQPQCHSSTTLLNDWLIGGDYFHDQHCMLVQSGQFFYCWKKTHSLERCIDLRQKSASESSAIAKLQIPLSVDKISPAPDVSSYICFFWKTSLCKPCEMQDSIFGLVRTNVLYPLFLRNKYPPLLFASSGNNSLQYFFNLDLNCERSNPIM